MKVKLLGTRGSVGRAGPETVRYGGDTSSVEVRADDGSLLLLDAGSGVVHTSLPTTGEPVHVFLTHLHMDHIQGLGFLRPLFNPDIEVHLFGPVSSSRPLAARLGRYLSPPLFPVHLRDLPNVTLHEVGAARLSIGPFTVMSDYIIHPGRTLGVRVEADGRTLAYMPDHEPALGKQHLTADPMWTSGYELARDADLLIHDTQYTDQEYDQRVGWGHSTLTHAADFAAMARVGRLMTFHHEPDHTDALIDELMGDLIEKRDLPFELVPGIARTTVHV